MGWSFNFVLVRPNFFFLLLGLIGLLAWPAAAVTVDAADQQLAQAWLDRHFSGEPPNDPPFSFVYDGKSSRELLAQWKFSRAEKKLEGGKTESTLTFTGPGRNYFCIITRKNLLEFVP